LLDKRISFDEAAGKIQPGQMLALGGVTLYRRPMSFVRALLRRHAHSGTPTNLTLLAFTGGMESDLLIGSGMVKTIRSCYIGLEIFGLAPMFTYHAGQGLLTIVEETELSLALGLRASLGGVGFMPGFAWLGTNMLQLRPDVQTIRDPYSGEELVAFPAIHPDVAVIHAICADPEGNAAIGDNKGIDMELAMSADLVILTTEEIVPALTRADITAPFVDHVVLAPQGARPTSCHPLYPIDGKGILHYTDQVSDPNSFQLFLKQFLALD
jgi:glutaconate CoA-transferase subunit A